MKLRCCHWWKALFQTFYMAIPRHTIESASSGKTQQRKVGMRLLENKNPHVFKEIGQILQFSLISLFLTCPNCKCSSTSMFLRHSINLQGEGYKPCNLVDESQILTFIGTPCNPFDALDLYWTLWLTVSSMVTFKIRVIVIPKDGLGGLAPPNLLFALHWLPDYQPCTMATHSLRFFLRFWDFRY